MRIHLLLAVIAFTVAAIAKSDMPCRNDVPFDSILSTSTFRRQFELPEDHVIRTEEQWCEFWARVHADMLPPQPCDLDLIDFRHEAILVTAIGTRHNTCFDASISCIEAIRGRGSLRVFVREQVPRLNCICFRSFVSPIHAVAVDKPVGRVEFVHEVAVLQCGN